MSTPFIIVVTTVASHEDAQTLARLVMEHRFAACVHLGAIESLYFWQGSLRQYQEYRLLMKTIPERYFPLESFLRQHHPYDLPAIYTLSIDQIEPAYGSWVEAEIGLNR